MSTIFLLLGLACIGYLAFDISKKLFAVYPYGVTSTNDKFWWSKWLPGIGFALCLIAAGEPIYMYIPGILLIIGSTFFLPKTKTAP